NGIHDVQVLQGEGFLSDHFDPVKKRVVLSPDNFNKPTVAGTAIAAHEVGHAIQHAHGYAFLKFRTALLPLANLRSSLSYIIILAGIVLTALNNTFGITLLWVGIVFMSFAVLFTIIKLSVEFDASKREIRQIEKLNMVNQ